MDSLDFVPTEKLKKHIQSILLNLFKEFKRVCSKHNVKYLANRRTLIGAARHHGFIPWDDDMDISMMYDDFVN